MGLMRDPFSEMNTLRRQVFRFLDPWWKGFRAGWPALEGPRMDVYQTDDEVVATAELPGVESKDDLEVTVTENSLSIKGEFKRSQDQREENFFHSERYYGVFNRIVPLPAEVKSDQARATYRNGILEVRIPKAQPGKNKSVKVDIH